MTIGEKKYRKNYMPITALFLVFYPKFIYAATTPPQNFKQFVDIIIGLINSIVPILVTLALIGFLWGAAQFVYNADNAEKRSNGQSMMIYGVVSLFVIIGLWGIVSLAHNTFF